ncbi:MAG TPA: AbrB/MazE/SpoVT family DNA-binding domain-containing protein [Terracidiphilus sp.]|jgi:antitoxin MazE|nr:AbrB/MazE/SpoVT family DNA-binding domain-containing protein [Terracidiphilus sp.]
MKLARWGNSLAIRIPAEIAEKSGLNVGDEANIVLTADNVIEIRRDDRREQALKQLRAMRVPLPEGFKFDRDEIYDN